MEVLSFQAATTKYCIDIMNVQEIVLLTNKITKVDYPKENSISEGITLVRDETVEVIDIYKLLDIEKIEDYEKDFLIILRKKEGDSIPKGLRVNNLENVLNTRDFDKQSLQMNNSKFVNDVFIQKTEEGNQLLVLLNDRVI